MSYVLECQHAPRRQWWLAQVSARGPVAHLPSLELEANRLLDQARHAHAPSFRVRIREHVSRRVVFSATAT